MRKEKHGKLPVNARISIDYSGKNPKVKFGYPKGQDHIKMNQHLVLLPLMLLFFVAYFFLFNPQLSPFEKQDIYPTNCSFIESKDGTAISNITFKCDNGIYKILDFSQSYNRFKNKNLAILSIPPDSGFLISDPEGGDLVTLLQMAFLFFFIFGIPILLTNPIAKVVLKSKKLQRKIPDINKALQGRGYKAIFRKVPDALFIEIPLFKNIYLDYYAEKDFSRYLTKMEIKEHPFWKMLSSKNKKKRKRNIGLWYARFYFKEKPKTGKLEVLFK